MKPQSYKDLIVWQKSMDLAIEIYKITKHFPKEEVYVLTSQMKRAAISIPSNIAEGSKRGSRKDFCHFLYNSFGSGAELETQIELAKRLEIVSGNEFKKIDELLNEIMRMLNKFIDELKKSSHTN